MRVDACINLHILDLGKGTGILATRSVSTAEPLTAALLELFFDLGESVLWARTSGLLRLGRRLLASLSSSCASISVEAESLDWIESFGIELLERIRLVGVLCLHHLSNLVDSELTVPLTIPRPNVKEAIGHLLLTSYEDIVPLC